MAMTICGSIEAGDGVAIGGGMPPTEGEQIVVRSMEGVFADANGGGAA
jgi:hypothetical protein